jgi:hypothetical protein
MKPRHRQKAIFLVLIVMFAGCATTKYPVRERVESVEFEYHVPWRLGKRAAANLLQAARACGITNIESVWVGNMLPSIAVSFEIKAPEQISGRNIERRLLAAEYINWNPQSSFESTAVILTTNGFRIAAGWTEKKKILRAGGAEHRIQVDDKISIDLAEEILDVILRGKVSFEDDFAKRGFENAIKTGKVTSIEKRGENSFQIRLWELASGHSVRVSRDPKTGLMTVVSVGTIVV